MTAEMAAERAFKDALRDELDGSDREYGTINTNLTQCEQLAIFRFITRYLAIWILKVVESASPAHTNHRYQEAH